MTPPPGQHPTADPPRAFHRGSLALVLIATAGGLAGCGSDPDERPVDVERAQYVSIDECVQDWGSETDCEPRQGTAEYDPNGMDRANPAGAASAGGSPAAGGMSARAPLLWLGPWFTRSGTVYRYDGRVQALAGMPQRSVGSLRQQLSPSQIYAASAGRYATTAAHPQAAAAKLNRGRGGFGGTGRVFSSSGG